MHPPIPVALNIRTKWSIEKGKDDAGKRETSQLYMLDKLDEILILLKKANSLEKENK